MIFVNELKFTAITFRITSVDMIKRIRYKDVNEVILIHEPGSTIGSMLLVVPYKVICKEVFDPVVRTIIDMIKKQIRNIGTPIATTFLVGGFGNNPYLQYKIKEAFKIKENDLITGYGCGKLLVDRKGDTAIMRGALYYGLDAARNQSNIEAIRIDPIIMCQPEFYFDTYSTLLCIGNSFVIY